MRVRFLLLAALSASVGCQTDADGLEAAASPATENPLQASAAIDATPIVEVESADALIEAIRDVDSDLVLVNYWATWCGPCRVEFPDLVRYAAENEDGVAVRFVSVDMKADQALVQDFLNEHGVGDPAFLYTGPGELIGKIDAVVAGLLPVTMVFNGEGELLKSHLGLLTYDKIGQLVLDAQA